MKKVIVKMVVCKLCFDMPNEDCKCLYDRVERIELEFEQCPCCENIELGNPIHSEFNTKQLGL